MLEINQIKQYRTKCESALNYLHVTFQTMSVWITKLRASIVWQIAVVETTGWRTMSCKVAPVHGYTAVKWKCVKRKMGSKRQDHNMKEKIRDFFYCKWLQWQQWERPWRADTCVWWAGKRLNSKTSISTGDAVGRYLKDKWRCETV